MGVNEDSHDSSASIDESTEGDQQNITNDEESYAPKKKYSRNNGIDSSSNVSSIQSLLSKQNIDLMNGSNSPQQVYIVKYYNMYHYNMNSNDENVEKVDVVVGKLERK